jgi:hypothetical protein
MDNIEKVFRLPLLVRAAWCLMEYEELFGLGETQKISLMRSLQSM